MFSQNHMFCLGELGFINWLNRKWVNALPKNCLYPWILSQCNSFVYLSIWPCQGPAQTPQNLSHCVVSFGSLSCCLVAVCETVWGVQQQQGWEGDAGDWPFPRRGSTKDFTVDRSIQMSGTTRQTKTRTTVWMSCERYYFPQNILLPVSKITNE